MRPFVLAAALLVVTLASLPACEEPPDAGPEVPGGPGTPRDGGPGAEEDGGLCAAPAYTTPLPASGTSGPCNVGPGVSTASPGPVGAAATTESLVIGPYTWTVHENLTYAVRGGRALQGDLFVPTWTATRRPGVVLGIHGGGWMDCGRRRDAGDVVLFLLKLSVAANAAVFNVEYRLSQEGGGFPENLKDVRCAAQYVVARASNEPGLGIDGTRVVVAGESAGAHLTAMLALTQGRADLDPGCSHGGAPAPTPNLLGAYAFSPVTDLPELYASGSLAKEAPQLYSAGACDDAQPQDVLACGCPSPNRCVDASPLRHACLLPEDTQLVLVHAPRTADAGEHDFLIPFTQSQQLHDAVAAVRPGNVQLWVPPPEAITDGGCYAEADIVKQGGALPDGGGMPFAHGFMPCLYEPLLPLLGPSVKALVGGE